MSHKKFVKTTFSYNEVLDDDSEGLSSLCLIVMYTFIVAVIDRELKYETKKKRIYCIWNI
ncbi:hypothetical protein RhiirA1_534970 [Rhizophagus irregularis]|uniref:Uncharacterized protein n=1 Tax=Rhizophagus irregularis TaxID=588596 RepID=A0A2N0RVI2_9GLOM|nr:hypothetical protein RhiirA1_534970 [Rhizophagus irregularis]